MKTGNSPASMLSSNKCAILSLSRVLVTVMLYGNDKAQHLSEKCKTFTAREHICESLRWLSAVVSSVGRHLW